MRSPPTAGDLFTCSVGRDYDMPRFAYPICAALLILCGTGCSTLVKRSVKEVRGAQSEVEIVPGTVSQDFSRFQGAHVSPPRSELGSLVPPEYTSALQAFLADFLTNGDDAPFTGGKPALEIDPQIQWYHHAGGLGSILGSDSYAVVLLHLRGEGSELGRLQLVTKNAAMHVKEEGMAESAAKELAKWFSKIRENGLPEE